MQLEQMAAQAPDRRMPLLCLAYAGTLAISVTGSGVYRDHMHAGPAFMQGSAQKRQPRHLRQGYRAQCGGRVPLHRGLRIQARVGHEGDGREEAAGSAAGRRFSQGIAAQLGCRLSRQTCPTYNSETSVSRCLMPSEEQQADGISR